jgi:hypothetical protein
MFTAFIAPSQAAKLDQPFPPQVKVINTLLDNAIASINNGPLNQDFRENVADNIRVIRNELPRAAFSIFCSFAKYPEFCEAILKLGDNAADVFCHANAQLFVNIPDVSKVDLSTTETISLVEKYVPKGLKLATCSGLKNLYLFDGPPNSIPRDHIQDLVKNQQTLEILQTKYWGADIANSAFDADPGFLSLRKVIGFTDVTTIGRHAFRGQQALASVDFPSVTTVDDEAFYMCTSLASVNLPAVSVLQPGAFYLCTSLESAHFPLLTDFHEKAFFGCSSLTSVYFPSFVHSSAPNGILAECSHLSTVNLPIVTIIENSMFAGCSALATVICPLVTIIGSSAFRDCTGLTDTLFSTLTEIKSDAFSDCSILPISITVADTAEFGAKAFSYTTISSLRIVDTESNFNNAWTAFRTKSKGAANQVIFELKKVSPKAKAIERANSVLGLLASGFAGSSNSYFILDMQDLITVEDMASLDSPRLGALISAIRINGVDHPWGESFYNYLSQWYSYEELAEMGIPFSGAIPAVHKHAQYLILNAVHPDFSNQYSIIYRIYEEFEFFGYKNLILLHDYHPCSLSWDLSTTQSDNGQENFLLKIESLALFDGEMTDDIKTAILGTDDFCDLYNSAPVERGLWRSELRDLYIPSWGSILEPPAPSAYGMIFSANFYSYRDAYKTVLFEGSEYIVPAHGIETVRGFNDVTDVYGEAFNENLTLRSISGFANTREFHNCYNFGYGCPQLRNVSIFANSPEIIPDGWCTFFGCNEIETLFGFNALQAWRYDTVLFDHYAPSLEKIIGFDSLQNDYTSFSLTAPNLHTISVSTTFFWMDGFGDCASARDITLILTIKEGYSTGQMGNAFLPADDTKLTVKIGEAFMAQNYTHQEHVTLLNNVLQCMGSPYNGWANYKSGVLVIEPTDLGASVSASELTSPPLGFISTVMLNGTPLTWKGSAWAP